MTTTTARHLGPWSPGPAVAREEAADYVAATSAAGAGEITELPPSLDEALAAIEAAIAVLDEVDTSIESDEAVRAAAVALPAKVARLQARHVGVVGEVDRRGAYAPDGAITMAAWYRNRANCDPAEAQALVAASRRLRELPAVADAFAAGDISWAHVTAVTRAATPQRMAAIAEHQTTLAELARSARPAHVRVAVRRIRDLVDDDGSQVPPLADEGPDPRRALSVRTSIDKLGVLDGPLDPVTTELLLATLEAYTTADAPETPAEQRRTPAQRRHDAFHDLIAVAAAAGPTVHGSRPHVLALVDIATLAGADDEATHTPRLRHLGEVPANLARRIAREARVTAVKTMGPWRPVNVGRKHRTLPAYLRDLLIMFHRYCRAPDCDRPASWSQAHHLSSWGDGNDTDLTDSIPVCPGHHAMVTTGGWTVTMDPDTGVCTWTSPEGKVIHTDPPAP